MAITPDLPCGIGSIFDRLTAIEAKQEKIYKALDAYLKDTAYSFDPDFAKTGYDARALLVPGETKGRDY